MDNRIMIRKAKTSREAESIASMAEFIWMDHYIPIIGVSQTEYMIEKFQSKQAIYDGMRQSDEYFLAYYEDVPCGYGMFRVDTEDKSVFLSKLYVDKKYRRKGVAKAMMDFMIKSVRTQDCDKIWLTCNKHNTKAICAYEKMGFEITNALVTDIGSGYVMDDYRMEKEI